MCAIATTLPRGSANPRVWQNVGSGARNPAYMQPTSRDKISFGWAPSQEKLERARQLAGGSGSGAGGAVWSPAGAPGYALNRNYSMQELPTNSRTASVRHETRLMKPGPSDRDILQPTKLRTVHFTGVQCSLYHTAQTCHCAHNRGLQWARAPATGAAWRRSRRARRRRGPAR